jgi:hypothetical protein
VVGRGRARLGYFWRHAYQVARCGRFQGSVVNPESGAKEAGVRAFTEVYGLLEKITVMEPADNACSEARVTTRFRHRPGASPLLLGRFLMRLGAFVSLEDISDALPPYQEEVVSVEMDEPLKKAYEDLEEGIKKALREHRGN